MGNPPTLMATLDKCCDGYTGYTVCLTLPDSKDGYTDGALSKLPLKEAKKTAEGLVDQWLNRFEFKPVNKGEQQ